MGNTFYMINELMQEVKETYLRKEALDQRFDEIRLQIKEIESELNELNYVEPEPNLANKIRNIFNKYFRKQKYLEGQTSKEQYHDLTSKMSELLDEQTNVLNEKKAIDNNAQLKDINEATIKSPPKLVGHLLQQDPKLAEREDFMQEAVEIDPLKILNDKTNAPEVYKKYVQEVKKKIEKSLEILGTDHIGCNEVLDIYNEIINEIDNPKKPGEGKYKIPHKYLFESIRISAKYIKENGGLEEILIKKPRPDVEKFLLGTKCDGHGNIGTIQNLKNYFECDCTYPKEYGEFLESMYDKKDLMLIQHKFNPDDEQTGKQKTENAFIEGKQESIGQKQGNKSLEHTFNGEFSNCGFCGFFTTEADRNWGWTHKILALIPRAALDKNNNIPLWGSDKIDGPAFLLPEYIIGIEDKNHNFQINPIPKDERKQYTYHFKDKAQEPIAETKEQKVEEEGR